MLLFGTLAATLLPAEESSPASIWKISDEDSTVYLAGSVHLLREIDMPVPPAFDRVYYEAEEVIFEIDMALMTDPSLALKVRDLGTLPEGKTLKDSLGPNTILRLQSYLKGIQMPVGLFDRFTPGMVYLTLASLEATRNGARPELGLETLYYQKCLEDGKPSRGLETIEFQMSRFNELESDMVESLINEALDEIDEGTANLDAIIAAWKNGDAEGLEELIVDQISPSPQLQEVLLTSRNRNWVPEIEKHLATDHDVMFLVGAAHLVGENSVVDLMREKGYEVLQLANGQ